MSKTTTESDDNDDDYSSDEEENDDDFNEFIAERKLILADAKNLKTLAVHYLHPEKPVDVVDATVFGRNYFGRASAPTEYDDDDNYTTTLSRVRDGRVVQDMEDERSAIMEELKELRTTADWFLHPEKPVDVVDATVFGRNYFGRASAPNEYDNADDFMTTLSRVRDGLDVQDMEDERNAIMEELKQLKTTADWYFHPEMPIVCDATACGRNYFTRPSAPEYDDDEEDDMEEERQRVLEEAAELKKVADWYLHPEKKVAVDSTVCGRNYFTRASAPEYDDNMEEEREHALADAAELKKVAGWYFHPETK